MAIFYCEATKSDINELVRLRIAYMVDDFGNVSDYEKECMERQLPDYFARKLGDELIAFIAKDGDKIVSVAYLHIIEMQLTLFCLMVFMGRFLAFIQNRNTGGKDYVHSL